MPIFGAVYSDEPLGFVAESFCCVGNESQLIDCPSPFPLGRPASVGNLREDQRHLFNVAGVRCSDGESGVCGDGMSLWCCLVVAYIVCCDHVELHSCYF